MRRFRSLMTTLLLLVLITGCARRTGEKPLYPWVGAFEEGQVQLVGPGRVSSGGFEMNAALTPDGKEIYFSRSPGANIGGATVLLHSTWLDTLWTKPDTLAFSGHGVDADPFLTKDGKRLYFASKRREDGGLKGDFDLWYVDRVGQGWSQPVRLPEPVNSRDHDVSPWITDDGTLWFSSRREGGEGDYDIWYAPAVEGGFAEPINAGPTVNSFGVEVDVCLSGDSRLLIFASHDQPVHFGSGDLYAMILSEDEYVGPYNLGQPVNSEAMECCPSISPDGRLLLFSSTRTVGRMVVPSEEGVLGDENVPQVPNRPGNGLGDLYAVELAKLVVIQEFGWSPTQ